MTYLCVRVCLYSCLSSMQRGNAYAPYCDVICGPSVSSSFFDIISLTAQSWEKKLLKIKCLFWFSLQLLTRIFLIRRIQWDVINMKTLSCNRYFCRILMKLEFFRQIFENKSLNIKFHKNLSSGSRVVACGETDRRTDRQTDLTKLTVAFRKFANSPKIEHVFL